MSFEDESGARAHCGLKRPHVIPSGRNSIDTIRILRKMGKFGIIYLLADLVGCARLNSAARVLNIRRMLYESPATPLRIDRR